MSNEQRLPFSTTDHPVLFRSIYANNDNNESDGRSISNINKEMDEDSSSSSNKRPTTPNDITISVLKFESAKFKDVNVDEEGHPIGIFGVPWRNIVYNDLLMHV